MTAFQKNLLEFWSSRNKDKRNENKDSELKKNDLYFGCEAKEC